MPDDSKRPIDSGSSPPPSSHGSLTPPPSEKSFSSPLWEKDLTKEEKPPVPPVSEKTDQSMPKTIDDSRPISSFSSFSPSPVSRLSENSIDSQKDQKEEEKTDLNQPSTSSWNPESESQNLPLKETLPVSGEKNVNEEMLTKETLPPVPDPAFASGAPNLNEEKKLEPDLSGALPPPPSSPPPAPSLNGATDNHGPSFFARFKKVGLALILLLFLAGAGFAFLKFVLPTLRNDESGSTEKKTVLTYWGLWEPPEIMSSVIADFEDQNPGIKIDYQQSSKQDYRERLQSRLAKGDGPDLFRFHITWVPMLIDELEPVPPEVMSAQEFEASFYPVAVDNLRSEDRFMGLPLEVDTLALFYNEELLQKASESPPQDWNEFYEVAKKLTVVDGGQIKQAGAALGLTGNVEHWSDVLGLLMLQSGVDLSRPNTPQAQSVLDYFTKFKSNRIWDETLPSSTIAFASGKLAMYFGFSWDVFEIKELNPELSFRVIPVPQLTATEINWASFWAEGVSLKSKNKKEAWVFLKYLSQPEVLRKLYQQESQVRLFGEPYARKEMASEISSNPMVAPFVSQAPYAQTWYLCSRTFDNGLNDRIIRYFEDAINAVSIQGEASSEALATVADGVTQLLARYQISASY